MFIKHINIYNTNEYNNLFHLCFSVPKIFHFPLTIQTWIISNKIISPPPIFSTGKRKSTCLSL